MNWTNLPFSWSIRQTFKEGYGKKDFTADLLAGVVVAIVAIPLGMALAIASGAPPQVGLYTVIVSGIVLGLFGGSKHNVTGPTAAFVVLLVPVVHKYGISGLYLAGLIAGVLCLLYGLFGLGQFIRYVPHPVTTGFTAGIAVVIGFLQLKDFFGLTYDSQSHNFVDKVVELFKNFMTFRIFEFGVGGMTLALIIIFARRTKRIPAPILALSSVTILTIILKKIFPDFAIDTIDSRYSYILDDETFWGIPQVAPSLQWPWSTSSYDWSWGHVAEIFPAAFSISLLGSIESLLSALIAEGATQVKHDPDSELVGLGIANILCPFFGGIPATGAIARTTTNIRFGARSSIACIVHSIFTLLVILTLAPIIGMVPMASLAALLLFVAYNMSERLHFMNIIRKGLAEDRLVLLACFSLTVFFDMTIGVSAGVILACVLFIRRLARLTQTQVVLSNPEIHYSGISQLPSDVYLYRISGSLFFGVAEKAMSAITNISDQVKKVVLDMSHVPMMDITGLVALDSSLKKLVSKDLQVRLIVPSEEVREFIKKSDLVRQQEKHIKICYKIEEALEQ